MFSSELRPSLSSKFNLPVPDWLTFLQAPLIAEAYLCTSFSVMLPTSVSTLQENFYACSLRLKTSGNSNAGPEMAVCAPNGHRKPIGPDLWRTEQFENPQSANKPVITGQLKVQCHND